VAARSGVPSKLGDVVIFSYEDMISGTENSWTIVGYVPFKRAFEQAMP
jgi:hypothetical protein